MRLKQAYLGLRCFDCRSFFEDDVTQEKCPKCGGLLDTKYEEDVLNEYRRDQLDKKQGSMWTFRMFLPVPLRARPITAGEGNTHLRRVKGYSNRTWIKDETRNPTGSFKDRGASAAITRLSQSRVRRVVLASEGNAGCSFALYSRIAGMSCQVYLPKNSNPVKVVLTGRLGADVKQVSGTISDAGRSAAKASNGTASYNASTFVTPYRHDGKGTIALEISEQLGWKSPDYIVYPTGGGVGLVGMWKMFKILKRIGWIRNTPRFVAVQPSGCAPVVEAYNLRRDEVSEWSAPRTMANGLKIPKPLAGKWILKSLRESNGIALKVTETEIRNAMHHVAKTDGILVEPSSAAAFAAVPRLYQSRLVDRGASLVVIATGSGLKTLEQY